MAAEDDNFFSRWSRRKVQVRSGEPLPPEPTSPEVRPLPTALAPAGGASIAAGQPPEPTEPAAPTPSLDDVAELTPESDFKRFVGRGVSPEVRNAAVKKLFADPHFNVMDGLDIYIDDYSQPSPLSAAMMAKMVGAQFLKLVDDPNEVKPPPVPGALTAELQTEPAELASAAEAPLEADTDTSLADATPDPTQIPHDDHTDLQLQPDHAAERESAGRGTG